MHSRTRLVGMVAFFALTASVNGANAQNADEAYASAQRTITQYRNGINTIQDAMARASRPEQTAEQRLADGNLLLLTRDFDRASVVFSQIVEKYRNNDTVYAEALFLLGETYYQSEQLTSARRVFRTIVEDKRSRRVQAFHPKALARLTDIAIRTRDIETLEHLKQQLGEAPSNPLLYYAKGRVQLAQQDLSGAKASLSAVPAQSDFYPQARYLLGVIALREAKTALAASTETAKSPQESSKPYASAIEAFRQVTQLPASTKEHRHVVDLGWLAIGRLHYETNQWPEAVEAYNHIDRQSPEFSNALFEVAATHMQMNDVVRAQRALEILMLVDPDGERTAEASLLRGDLELRSGQYRKSLTTFEDIRSQFEPQLLRVSSFLSGSDDPAVFYDKLVEDQLISAETGGNLPPLAIQWAREADDGPEAFAVVNEVVQTRMLLRTSEDALKKLHAVMNSAGRSKAFPEYRAGQQTAIGAIHGITKARVVLANALDAQEPSSLSGEIGSVRQQRRALQAQVLDLPVSSSDFQQRDNRAENRWNSASQKVQQLQLQIDTLNSVVNALQRVIRESASRGVVRDPASIRQFQEELGAHERELTGYQARLAELRQQAGQGRIASGFDDASVFDDQAVREQYKQLLAKEVELASRGAAGNSAAQYAQRIAPLLRSADEVEARYQAALRDINHKVDEKSKALLLSIAAEESKLGEFNAQLQQLDEEARLVVGHVAMRNFGLVRDRMRSIVMHAEVGITEQAWETRESQLIRVRRLQSERARSERLLDEELREVLDDAMDE
ncbi:MAG TPA: hypothetical protein PKL73_11550 [Polyangiaceae bacterium]|nr:MAG: Tetratricopeptide repeat protein [Deltaproteobacteria bacterium ADurb.Bin207]HNS97576.1 hypothetical protein [Polyangiaceae bacterium]HNZ21760.1 hypothetical protein [Polyangiaceae bacterium]HOD25048.1 hypothetical protein [Polyangiaceae bacterium]HOE50781.1 hypothetical protein [Polyangiaceae bacterium]